MTPGAGRRRHDRQLEYPLGRPGVAGGAHEDVVESEVELDGGGGGVAGVELLHAVEDGV